MNNKTTAVLLLPLLLAVLTFTAAAFGKEINDNAGTSAFPFLKINVGARAVAMGGAFTGLANDESALYYNPAGIASLEDNRFILGYLNYFEDIQSGFVGYIRTYGDRRFANRYFLGFYIDYLNYGNFVETDRFGQTLGEFSGGDLLLAVSFAKKQEDDLMFGVTAKFIYEKVHDFSATGLAADFGVKHTIKDGRHSVGLMIQNLGTQLSALGNEKYKLPLTFRAGGSVQPTGLPLLISGDIIFPIDNDLDFALGGEYNNFKPLFLRLGYNSFGSNYKAADSDDNWAGLSFGVGFDIKQGMQLSYSYSPAADLGDMHRITLNGRAKW
ncbi:MAG: PorV/PorQ family protein [candidate division Zixibacteria bacterium]|nr:PorV/PorQ family protein [candidate division Zixibacteria bacterium]